LILSSFELIHDDEKYEIEEIIEKQQHKSDLWYKIRWKNYSFKYD